MDALARLEALERSMDEDGNQVVIAGMIASVAENKPNMTELDLRHKQLTSNQLLDLIETLRWNTNITNVAFTGNTLESSVVSRLAILLIENRTIMDLELDFCDLTDEHARVLIAALEIRKTKLAKIRLLGNTISAKVESELVSLSSDGSSKKPGKSSPSSTSPTESSNPTSLKNNFGAKTLIEEMSKQLAVMAEQLKVAQRDFEKAQVDDKKKKMDQVKKYNKVKVNLSNISINELTATGNSTGTNLYSCMVDGWQCCMKEMSLDGVSDSEMRAFESEIELLEKLPFHTNIVRYLFHVKTDDRIRLFMTKYAVSLRDVVTNRRIQVSKGEASYFHPQEIAKWIAQIASGVDFLHKNHVIHRNLKPDNILCTLDSHGFMSNLAITEFDSAKSITKKKQAKTTIGTPSYMSPEVISSDGTIAYTHKVDVWGIGMIMYELITLMVPYEDENFAELNTLITSGKLPSTHHIASMYDPLLTIFRDCTQLDATKRPEVKRISQQLLQIVVDYSKFDVSTTASSSNEVSQP